MIRHAVALRWARALFYLDHKTHDYKKRLEDFDYIFALFAQYPKLYRILKAPLVLQSEKEELLKNAVKARVDPIFLKFLLYLMKKKRLHALKEIFVEYELLLDHEEQVWEARLVSGVAVDSKHKGQLLEKLEKFYDKKVVFKEQVDPKILGGTFLILGNKMIDWSVKTRMEKLQTYLLGQNICR